ncbi:phosphoribosylanthranilate isomerase [Pedobacter deserti]|uniref:phosphoribosylanthranilate isomerase n=1 Tax=Pedobacter deserti TaxID=2817382 RepID=UPI00210C79B2|nr:phosphoribosylanthranilate isomerase [Pedobacter sp. SYSU D00382]
MKLKVCGMREPENIGKLAELQPEYMGFIFYTGSKRYAGEISAEIVRSLPPAIKKTGVFVDEKGIRVSEIEDEYELDAIQLHGSETPEYCKALRTIIPARTELIKAFGIDEHFDFSVLDDYADAVDYFLFDTQTAGHGGSGKRFDWKLLEGYKLDKPFFLSGGIGPESLEELQQVSDPRCYAIDVNSRFELSPGLKDIEQLKAFKIRL